MFKMICSKTHHADMAAKIARIFPELYHGNGSLIDEYVSMMSDISAFRAKCDEAVFASVHCYHTWSKDTSGFNLKEGGEALKLIFGGIDPTEDTVQGSTQRKTPSNIAPPDVDFYAALHTLCLTPVLALHTLCLTPLIFRMKFKG